MLGLVTTRGANSLPRLLKLHGLDRLFDVQVNRTDTERRKPHPHPLALALEWLGVEDPSRTLYVGDSQAEDVGAGRALGMKTALVNKLPLDKYGPIPTYHWQSLEPLSRMYGR
jgi:FMN phosphatase YigB (HAD superfamily)